MMSAQDSTLLNSALTALLNAQQANQTTLLNHETRISALEKERTGPASSPTSLLERLAKILAITATVIRYAGPIFMYVGPWLALAWAAIWKWLLPLLPRLAGL